MAKDVEKVEPEEVETEELDSEETEIVENEELETEGVRVIDTGTETEIDPEEADKLVSPYDEVIVETEEEPEESEAKSFVNTDSHSRDLTYNLISDEELAEVIDGKSQVVKDLIKRYVEFINMSGKPSGKSEVNLARLKYAYAVRSISDKPAEAVELVKALSKLFSNQEDIALVLQAINLKLDNSKIDKDKMLGATIINNLAFFLQDKDNAPEDQIKDAVELSCKGLDSLGYTSFVTKAIKRLY